jgi:serine beta-lactamase-like protein LACTB, mitochondrial
MSCAIFQFTMLRNALTLILVSLVATISTQPQPLDQAKVAAVERVVSTYMSKVGAPGLSVAVAVDGSVVWSGGYGFADFENFVPATSDTVYRTASIGKSITATAAMRLVEQGKLNLDEPVQVYCAAFPPKKWKLTPRHLLSHTGGIRHYGGPHDLEEQTSTIHYGNVVDALAPFKNDPLLFEPGTEWRYSTYGYDVLGCVVEGAAHVPFVELIQHDVFDPAGMSRTRTDDPAAIISKRAAGYVRINGELQNAKHVDMSNRLPAGGYVTTAPELAKFAASLMDCKLVSCATRDAMLTETVLKNGSSVNYGLGWAIVEDASGHPNGQAFHGGSSPGVSGMLYIVPGRRLAVAMLMNLEDAPERLPTVTAIANIVLPDETVK